MRLTSLIAVALAMCAALIAGRAHADDLPEMRAIPVAPNAWYVQGQSALGSAANRNFISNAGFVVTPDGVVVIDALGSPAMARRLQQTIAAITPKPVIAVILTHYHADHIYGAQVFKASIDDGLTEPGTALVEPDTWLDGGTAMTFGGVRFELLHVGPAHTPEDLAVLIPSLRLLYAGDLVFRGRVPYVGAADSRRWIESLDRLLALQVDTIVPGHGPHSTQAREDLQLTRDYLAYLRRTMGAAAKEMTPFDDAYAATDWSRFEALPLFKAANRMNAYNTYLLMEQEKP